VGIMPDILQTYLQNESALKRFLRRFATQATDAEDLAQEAFIRAYAAEAGQTISSPKAFLFRVARNLALNERARAANATSLPLEDFAETAVIEDVGQVALEDEMEARQRIRMLAEAMAGLPPQCSKVFLLRKVHGLSYKEIAERLGISVSTAEKHAALGLLRCSEYLRQHGVDGGLPKPKSGQVATLELRRRK
jgi:RNA polymerase sigma-70 factor (ECF subfamily)